MNALRPVWKPILLGILLFFCQERGLAQQGSSAADETKLFEAITLGDNETARKLIAGKNLLKARNEAGQTPFMAACKDNRVEIAKALIVAGADVNDVSRSGSHSLGFAAETDNLELVKMMVERGAKLEVRYSDGLTVLVQAIANNGKNVVPYLIEKGADVNTKTDKGVTPLMIAAALGKTAFTRMLLAAGADPYVTAPDYFDNTSARLTALNVAYHERNKNTAAVLRQAMGIRADQDLTSMEGDPW